MTSTESICNRKEETTLFGEKKFRRQRPAIRMKRREGEGEKKRGGKLALSAGVSDSTSKKKKKKDKVKDIEEEAAVEVEEAELDDLFGDLSKAKKQKQQVRLRPGVSQ